MKIRTMLIGLGLAVGLIFAAAEAFAGHPGGMFPHHGMHPLMGPVMAADKQHLYVLAGPKLMQYSLGDLKLVKIVDLPKPPPPKEKAEQPCPPPFPPMGGHQALLAGDGSLYVLAGPMLCRYSTPDLALKNTAEMPKPEMPKPALPKAGN